MLKYTISFICFFSANSAVFGKSLYKYNVNPEHDLVGAEATSFANFWQNSDYGSSHYHRRHKHHGNGRGHGSGGPGYNYGVHKLKPNHPDFDRPHEFSDPFDFDSEEYENPGINHGYGRPQHSGYGRPQHPGHDRPQHPVHPPHPHYGYNHPEPPRRFPPPPVYDKDFINPWIIPGPVEMMPRPVDRTPTIITTPVTTSTTTTTAAPSVVSSTTNADGLIYDIDLRFGQ